MADPGTHEPTDEPPVSEPPQGPRRLLRSANDQVIGGVAGGLGHYFGLDPVLVRVAFVLLVLAGGSGILLYIILWVVIPEASPSAEVAAPSVQQSGSGALLLGGALVFIGVAILLRQIIPWFDSDLLWPLLLVGLGAAILLKGARQ